MNPPNVSCIRRSVRGLRPASPSRASARARDCTDQCLSTRKMASSPSEASRSPAPAAKREWKGALGGGAAPSSAGGARGGGGGCPRLVFAAGKEGEQPGGGPPPPRPRRKGGNRRTVRESHRGLIRIDSKVGSGIAR